MLEKEQREENTKTKKPAGSAELMGCAAKRLRQARHALSSATPANSSCHSPARGQGPEDAGSPEGPARACPSVARPVWPAAGRGNAAPGKAGGAQARLSAGRPRGPECSCQVPSCRLASFSHSFNVHSSRISESSQHQLSSDLFLHGGCYDHRGHLTSGSRPGFLWQSRTGGAFFHLSGDSDGSHRPLPHPAF